jgi:S1-C subfamily serine protease
MDISSNLAATLNRNGVRTPGGGGVLVADVVRRGPAEVAGIRGPQRMGLLGNLRIPLGADYVLAIGDTPIRTRQDLTVLLETRHRVGDVVDVSLWRDGNVIQVPVELGPRPE